MNIIELATQRLQALSQTGVDVHRDRAGAAPGDQRVGTIPEPHISAVHEISSEKSYFRKDSKIESSSDLLANTARQSTVVTLNIEELEEAGILVATKSRSTRAEEFRHIKRPLLANARKAARIPGSRGSLIMVTSALSGEGKTFCSLNIAISMAIEVDMSVLLVDADVVRCNLMRTLGLQARKGLLDVLTNPSLDLSEVLLKTNVPKLSLLPAGTCNVRSTELLASDAMDRLLGEIAGRYHDRVVIFDTTPLLLTSEAKVLASHMGQIVVVVEEARTPYTLLQQAFGTVDQCPVVMSLLNKGSTPAPDYGSYYG